MKNVFTKPKKSIIGAAAVCLLLIILGGVFLGLFLSRRNLLTSQREAERWAGDSDVPFSQLSCFIPADGSFVLNDVYALESGLQKALSDAALMSSDGRLLNDCWSVTSTIGIRGEKANVPAARVTAVGGNFFEFHPLQLLGGSYIREDDFMHDRVVLDEELAWSLYGGNNLQGLPVEINGVPFTIAGVIRRDADSASSKAGAGGPGFYMSYSAWVSLTDRDNISCYELVMAEPISGFAMTTLMDRFPVKDAEIICNSERLGLPRLLSNIKNFDTLTVRTGAVAYPEWENAARIVDMRCSLDLLLVFVFWLLPALIIIIELVKLLASGYTGLTEKAVPKLKENVSEAVRRQERKAWQRRHKDSRD